MSKSKDGGFVLGDFELGSKGDMSREPANQERQQQVEDQKFNTLISALREGQCDELASCLGILSPGQREKLNSELNMVSGDLKWVQPEQQKEAIEIIGEIDHAETRDAQMKARKRLSDLLV